MMKHILTLALALAVGGIVSAQTPKSVEDTTGGNPIFIEVEQNPEFPGGMDALYQFLAANLKWPCKRLRLLRQGVCHLRHRERRQRKQRQSVCATPALTMASAKRPCV